MYEAFWGLKEKPFENTPDPRFFYASPQHQEAMARMLYCIRERKGAGLLTGVFGCGKTVVSQFILQELNKEHYRSAYIGNPRMASIDFLRVIAHQWGFVHPPRRKADVLIGLEELVQNNTKEGRDVVLFIDEAHMIESPDVFEELRLLLNFQRQDRFLVTLLLMGQPELSKAINENQAFEQRIGIKSHLGPLSVEETYAYIRHRLQVAGHPKPDAIFSPEALKTIYESTGGIPRRVNRLCDVCLLAGFGAETRTIDVNLVNDEVKGLIGVNV